MRHWTTSCKCLWSLLTSLTIFLHAQVYAQNLSTADIDVVTERLAQGATQSWEYGTRAEVLLELNASSYSVFSPTPLPPPQQIPSNLTSALSDVIGIAQMIVANRSTSNGNITGPQPLVNGNATGDPASIGVAVLLANWTGQSTADGLDYAGAAQDQLEFLLSNVSRTHDGAISQRIEQVQLWSDFVYMAPPFFAYYGVLTGNQSLVQEAYHQVSLYRKYLRDPKANNIWKHIQLGLYGTDNGHWSTGNGWAAAGMLRVLSTIKQSQFSSSMESQQQDLADWVQEIHDGMYPNLDSSGLFHNYAGNSSTFTDASSTALLASTVYRLSLAWGVHKYIPLAELSRKALSAPAGSAVNISAAGTGTVSVPSSTATSTASAPSASSTATGTPGLLHFTSDGWLTPVVDPYSYADQGQDSPESEAFVIAMQAAWRDWVADGAVGANGAVSPLARISWTWVVIDVMVVTFLSC
ncbi:Six-hairpin glycosidase-like protein [Pisolithus croceorrhizus]|nr:Six-hairpin glycosidase-like protein [Pisolithus croceorrhizus]KAI6122598.1 Six-hairpin glycosidase-like protein [Pisolithus croceorrhizus]